MSKYITLGCIVNTHGIKGELRILSNFEKKEEVFKPTFPIYIGEEKQKEILNSYRHHKEFEMITLKNYTNINEVLKYKGKKVYIKKEYLKLKEKEFIYEEMNGLYVFEQKEKLGIVANIVYNKCNILLYVKSSKNFYVPLNSTFIKNVNLEEQKIEIEGSKGLRI